MAQVFNYIDADWAVTNTYQQYDVVTVDNIKYVAKQTVPANTQITNETYWFKWVPANNEVIGDLSTQVTSLQESVSTANENISTLTNDAADRLEDVQSLQESVNYIAGFEG